jgi:bacteriocin biosynthesis cyclodehydratase domain-containing protein
MQENLQANLELESAEAAPKRVRMLEHYVIDVGPQTIQIRTQSRVTSMKGPVVEKVLPHVLPLLDGSLTPAEVVERAAAKVGAANAKNVLKALGEKGFLEEVETPDPSLFPEDSFAHYESMARYFLNTDQTGSRTQSLVALRQAKVLFIGGETLMPAVVSGLAHLGVGEITVAGSTDLRTLAEKTPRPKAGVQLTTASVPETHEGWVELLSGKTAAIVCVKGPVVFDPSLLALNTAAIEAKTQLMTVAHVAPHLVQIGPTIYPEVSACLRCLQLQFQRSVSFLAACGLVERMNVPSSQEGATAPLAELAASAIVTEIARAVTPGQPPLSVAHVLTLNLSSLETDRYKVLKVPKCPDCGPARNRPMMRIWG